MQSLYARWLVALHSRDFRLLWIGEFISAAGTAMFTVALNSQSSLEAQQH